MKQLVLLTIILSLPSPLCSEIFINPEQIASEIATAASFADVVINSKAARVLAKSLLSQVGGCVYITMSVPSTQRVQNLSWYFMEKRRQGLLDYLTLNDIGDFSCNYVYRRLRFSWLNVDSSGASSTLLRAEFPGETIWFTTGQEIPSGSRIIFPILENYSLVTALMDSGHVATWAGPPLPSRREFVRYWEPTTGSATTGRVTAMVHGRDEDEDEEEEEEIHGYAERQAHRVEHLVGSYEERGPSLVFSSNYSSAGCVIYVYSSPSSAKVFFNGREWYAPTATSSVRDPGIWEVRIKLPGYEDLVVRKRLTPGETWRVNAVLKRATK